MFKIALSFVQLPGKRGDVASRRVPQDESPEGFGITAIAQNSVIAQLHQNVRAWTTRGHSQSRTGLRRGQDDGKFEKRGSAMTQC